MDSSPRERTTVVPAIIAFGCVWGLIEVSLGGYLHLIHFAAKGTVLGGIGFTLMASFISLTRKPHLVPWLGLIAASSKFLDVVLFGFSPASGAVVNPAIAIMLEALICRLAAAIFLERRNRQVTAQAGIAVKE
jgi:hypothetical protein